MNLECDRVRLGGNIFPGSLLGISDRSQAILMSYETDRILCDLVRILHRNLHDLADSHQSEYLLQRSDHFIGIKAVIISQNVDIDAPLLLVDIICSLHA